MMESPPHLLIVDDDDRLRDLLRRFLSQEGFRVTAASDAVQARHTMQNMNFDLIVMDIMMPGESGLDLTATLRGQGSKIPILLLTARGEPDDRIVGLEQGADDYLPKPYEPRELVLRIRSILRRSRQAETPPPAAPVKFGPFLYDIQRGILRRDGTAISLTTAEQRILTILAQKPGQVVTREDMVDTQANAAETEDDSVSRSIDVQILRLRKKLEADPRFPHFIVTVRGRGYMLRHDG